MSSSSFAEFCSWFVGTLQPLPSIHLRNYTYKVSNKVFVAILVTLMTAI